MWKVYAKRLVASIVVLIGVSLVAFILMRLGGGDPARMFAGNEASAEEVEAVRTKMGLDKSYLIQYITYMKGILTGDFGFSWYYKMEVSELLATRIPQTLKIGAFGLVIALALSLTLGIVAAINHGKLADAITMIFVFVCQSMADVWLALLLILIFSVKLKWFPSQGLGGLKYMVLPAICMARGCTAQVTRLMRSGMVDVLNEDYITAARARGISKTKTYLKYAFRNALLPIVTTFGFEIGKLLAGALVVENVFGWPGMGQLIVQAVNFRDYQLVQSILLVSAAMLVVGNLIADLLLTIVDPRISFN